MATIEIELQANEKEEALRFEQDSVTIGRGLGNDILIEDPQVSRYHARIVFEEGSLILYDLRSRNGTKVNTEKISSCPLRGDEAIYIGQALLRARINAKDSVVGDGNSDEEQRPTRHQRVSGIIEVEEDGQPRETSIVVGEKSTVEFEQEAQESNVPLAFQENFESNGTPTEKDTESSLLPREIESDEPWRPFENCLATVLPLIRDPQIDSITITAIDTAVVRRNGQLETVAIRLTEGQLQEALRIVSASVRPSHSSQASAPAFSVRLGDGSELAGAGPAFSPPYGVLVISTPPAKQRGIQEFLKERILSQDMFYFLHGCVALRKSIIVSSANIFTARDLLYVLTDCIASNQRVTAIQGFSRIPLEQPHIISFGEKMSVSAAVLEAASRTRPDRVVVAEPLSGEAVRTYIDQIANGCQGSLAQVRTSTPHAAIAKLESAICQSDGRLPYEAVRTLVRESVQIIVQLYELPNGAPRVRSIVEVLQAPNGLTSVSPIFNLQQGSSVLTSPQYQCHPPEFLEELQLTGFEEAYRAFEKR